MESVNIAVGNRIVSPQAVVLLDPATGLPYTPDGAAKDSTGASITPDSWSHTYGYSGLQQLVTDTATDGTSTWVKTYTYTAGNLTAESKWVKA